MLRYAVLCFGLLMCVSAQLTKEQKEELHKTFYPMAEKCMEDLGVAKEDLEAAKESHDPTLVDSCFFSCMFKASGLIDDKGMFDNETGYKLIEKYVDNEDIIKKVKKVGETCDAVNDKDVSDGDKGCERAMLLIECFKENKSDFADA